ncbi:hypothetical protein BN874_1790003 [Candidatus Contendobacter odensis Run_B_J11]|uniref:Uncharacterized protein n=1 Tax=Candidatus Contendobacter odensis Run_B_J11 TaxID=1400861 RepID=A0A7U7GA30_9GAMM|nr:hypothetical protein BN874_1790003 [Candidatus Contendobacter odensis Run_B_J11]
MNAPRVGGKDGVLATQDEAAGALYDSLRGKSAADGQRVSK